MADGLDTADYDKFDSQCDKTMVGFVQNVPSITGESSSMSEHDIQCIYGVQQESYDLEEYNEIDGVEADILLATKSNINLQTSSTIKTGSKTFERNPSSGRRLNMLHRHVATDQTDALISFINSNDLGWRANTCLLQTHHPDYGSHCGQNLVETE